jgi:hypothetical protein
LGLVVYLGDPGLRYYLKVSSGQLPADDPDVFHTQDCLMASFENRDSLDRIDRQTIAQTGLTFKGRNAWPLFRSYLPGYFPWYLDSGQARFLTQALQQAAQVAPRFKNERSAVAPSPNMRRILARIPEGKTEPLRWKDKWLSPAKPQPPVFPTLPIDEIRLQRIKRQGKPSTHVWELDTFYFPGAVGDQQRPYFPRVIVILDSDSGTALHTFLSAPPNYTAAFQESILTFLENHKILPLKIRFRRDEDEALLRPLALKTGITLEKAAHLEKADAFHLAMTAHFQR